MDNRTVTIACLMWLISCATSIAQQRLFSDEVRMQSDKPMNMVMDFLERYFVELKTVKGTTIVDKMADDKVFFRKGRLSDYYNLCDTVPFTVNRVDKHYEVSWYNGIEPFITVVFPAQYDLIMGQTQKEIQQAFRSVICSAKPTNDVSDISFNGIEPLNDTIWIAKQEKFVLESLNDATYYIKGGEDTDGFEPLFDSRYMDYSAANLFHGIVDSVDRRMYVEQSVYGMTTVNYTISLCQWLDYCREQKLKVFFAVEEEREDGLLVMVIASSSELCYNHLLSVVLPNDFVTNQNVVLKARLTPYIPTHNVKDLYQKETQKRKKKIWQ